MRNEMIPSSPEVKSACTTVSRFGWSGFPLEFPRQPSEDSAQFQDLHQEGPASSFHTYSGGNRVDEGFAKMEDSVPHDGHSLYQEIFFLCTVKNLGDVPGPGSIYVETVVDGDSGFSFAKIYSAKNAMNAVDILDSRVLPFFERHAISIRGIHTQKTNEYCGQVFLHPYETYLATSHIQHLPIHLPGHPYSHFCEQFYRFLLDKFFPAALRKTFHLSMDELQKDLDTFVEAYNAAQVKSLGEIRSGLSPSSNFPVDL